MAKWVIAAVVAIIVIAGGAYLIVHKSSKTPNYSTSTGSSYSSGSNNQPSASSSTTNSSSGIVQTKTDSNGAQYLADAKGDPLYTYGADTNGVSNCTGNCVAAWPVYGPGSTTPSSLPSNVSVITRSDGVKQYAYKGMPLYMFSSDSVGNPTGDNVANFHLAKP